MTIFILGLIAFLVPHLWTGFARKGRERMVAQIGKGPYKGIYSLISIAAFVLIVIGWRSADATAAYIPPDWLRPVAMLLNLAAFILLVAAYAPKGKIAAAAKHPMLAGVKLWAFAHLLTNGEVRSLILFGSFLAYGIVDRIAVKRRGEPTPAAGPARNDLIAVLIGLALWAAVYLFLHRYIAGVALRP